MPSDWESTRKEHALNELFHVTKRMVGNNWIVRRSQIGDLRVGDRGELQYYTKDGWKTHG